MLYFSKIVNLLIDIKIYCFTGYNEIIVEHWLIDRAEHYDWWKAF